MAWISYPFNIIRGHVGAVLGVSVNEGLFDLGGQRLLVALERQYVVTALSDDLLGDFHLAARRVDGDDAAVQVQQLQQTRNGCDLVRLRLGRQLSQHHPVGGGKGTDHVQCAQPFVAVVKGWSAPLLQPCWKRAH